MDSVFPVWRTIKVGSRDLKTAGALCKAIKDRGMEIDFFAGNVVGTPDFKFIAEETEVDLALVSVLELGFTEVVEGRDIRGGRLKEIYASAKRCGLELCCPEAGPQLRMQYAEQRKHEWIVVAMNAIVDSFGLPWLFRLDHNVEQDKSILSLSTICGRLESFWPDDFRLVFIRPRDALQAAVFRERGIIV